MKECEMKEEEKTRWAINKAEEGSAGQPRLATR
jgi:hypothetical protein